MILRSLPMPAASSKAPTTSTQRVVFMRGILGFDKVGSISVIQKQPQCWKKKIYVTRSILGWMAFPAFIALIFAQSKVDSINPAGANAPWPDVLPRAPEFDTWLSVRNWSLLIAIILGVVSLPRLQAILGLFLTFAYFLWTYWLFASY